MSTTDSSTPSLAFAFCYKGADVAIHIGVMSWRGLPFDRLPTVLAAWPPCEPRGWSMTDAARDDLQAIAAGHGATLTSLDLDTDFLAAVFTADPTRVFGLLSAVDQRIHSMGLAFNAVTVIA